MTTTLHLVFGGPTSAASEPDVDRWYGEHLEQACSIPGVRAAHLFKPSTSQFPRTTVALPPTLAIYELETDDAAEAVETIAAARQAGDATGAYEPGRSIPGPPDGSFATDSNYQPAFFDLVLQWPVEPAWHLTADIVFLVFGGPTTPDVMDEVLEWYDPHLEHICTLPGIITGQRFKPSAKQLPELSATLPEVLAFYEMETSDLAADIKAAWSAHLQGMRTGTFEPGLSIPGPRDGIWDLDPHYQSAYYDLVARHSND